MAKARKFTDAELKANKLAEELSRDGFKSLNPEPRYWNVEGADPLQCVVLSRQTQKGGKGDVGFYNVVAMNSGKNGDYTDTKTGEVITPPPWEPGSLLRVGARHQIDDAFGGIVARKALVAIIPIEKVSTASGNTVWRFRIMARKLTPTEEKILSSFRLGDFGELPG